MFGSSDAIRESCTTIAAGLQADVQSALTEYTASITDVKARLDTVDLSMLGNSRKLDFLTTPVDAVATLATDFSNLFDTVTDQTIEALTPTLPAGLTLACQVDVDTNDLFLTLQATTSANFQVTESLDFVPADTKAKLGGLTYTDPNVALAGSATVVATIEIDVGTNGFALRVSGVSATFSGTGAVSTQVTWEGAGTVAIAGNVAVSNVVVPIVFPTVTTVDEFKNSLGEIHVGTLSGALDGQLAVTLVSSVAGQLPSPVLTFADDNLFDSVVPKVTVDADISTMEETILDLLTQLGELNINLGDFGLGAVQIGEVDVTTLTNGVTEMMQLAPIAEQYFLQFDEIAGYPTFKGLMAYVKQNLPLPQTSTSLGIDGLTLTGGWFPESEEVALNLRFELAANEPLTSMDGSVKNLIGDMDQLDSLFNLIGVDMGGQSLAVPQFQVGVVFQADVVIDVTVGLKTAFINQPGLTGAALAGNAFFRVNDLSAHAAIGLEPINIEMSIPLDGKLVVRDGSFLLGLGIKADFANAIDDEDTSVTTVAAETEITLLRLATGGASAFVDFVKQLKMTVVGTLDIVMPIELTTAFTGDKSLLPIVELHEESLFTLGIPKMSLDIDLSMLIPTLPGGSGASGNELTSLMGSGGLGGLIDDISGMSLPGLSIPGVPSVDNLLAGFGGKLDFVSILGEYTDLLVAFRQLSGGLSLDLQLDIQVAVTSLTTDALHMQVLALLKASFPTTFEDFDAGVNGLFNSSELTQKFDVRDYLQHFQVEFAIANTLASASADWGETDLIFYLATSADFGMTKRHARAMIRLLDLPGFDAVNSNGFPWDGTNVFNPANYLAEFKTALGFTSDITLGDLSAKLGGLVPTLGANPDFQKKMFAMLEARFPTLLTAFSGTSLTGVALDPLTGKEFDFADFLPQVGELLGLGNGIALGDLTSLLAKRPTIQGLVKFLKNRVLNGLELDISLGPLSFGGGLESTDTAMELYALVGLEFSAALKPTEVVTMITDAVSGLLAQLGEGGVLDELATGNALAALASLDPYMTFTADFALRVQAGLDIKPLVEMTGTPKLFVRVLEFSMEAGAAVEAFPTDMDFGVDLLFQLVTDVDLRFAVKSSATDAAPLVLVDQGVQQTANLTDRIKDSLTVEGSLDANLTLSGGPLPSTVFLGVEDTNLFDAVRPKFSVDVEIPRELMEVLRTGLGKAGDVGRFINAEPALSTTIPLVGRTLQDLLKVNGAGPDWGDFFIWDTYLEDILGQAEYANCLVAVGEGETAHACPRAKEVVTRFKTEMQSMTTDTFRAVQGVAPFFVNGGQVGNEFQFGFALNGGFSMAVTPPLADLIDDEDFDFTVNSDLVVNINFAFGIDIVVNTSAGITKVGPSDIEVRVNNFKLTADVAASVSAVAKIGIIEAGVEGGTGTLAASFEGVLNNKALTPLSTLTSSMFTFVKTATLDACLPFTAKIGDTDLGELGAAADDANGPRICVTDTDLFNAPAPAIATYNMKKLFDFKGMTPVQVMGMLRGLINIVSEFREQPVFDVEVPFTDVDVGDVLDFADEFSAKLLQKMLKVQDAKDRDSLELCLESDAFPAAWNVVNASEESAYFIFQAHLDKKEVGVILNNEQEFPLALTTATLKAATTVPEIVTHITERVFAAGLSESLRVEQMMSDDETPVALDQIRICTKEAVRSTDVQLTVRVTKTASESANDGDAVPTVLGFTHGTKKEAPRVPAFNNFQELLDVLAKATGQDLALAYTYGESPTDATKTELLLGVQLTLDLPTPSVEMAFGAEVDPLLEVYAAADISLTSAVTFDFEFGARMGLGAPELRAVGQVPSKDLEVVLTQELVIKVLLDKKPHTLTLRKDKTLFTELTTQVSDLTASGELAAGVTLTAASFTSPDDGRSADQKIVSIILKSGGAKRFETAVDAAVTSVTGLGSEVVKATLFEPIFKNLGFTADIALNVQNLEMSATLAVLEAKAYDGSGRIDLGLTAAFGSGTAMTLPEFAGMIMDDPFSVITAQANLTATAGITAEVTVPGLSLSKSADVDVALPKFTIQLTKNNVQKLIESVDSSGNLIYVANPSFTGLALPRPSDFTFALDVPSLPNLSNIKDMSLSQIIDLVLNGVEILFGKPGDATETGLIGNFPFLDTDIPLVSFSPKQAIQWIQEKLELLSAALADPGAGIKEVEKLIEKTLGFWPADDVNEVTTTVNGTVECYGSCLLEFDYDSVANHMTFQLQFELAVPTVTNVEAAAGDVSGINLALSLDLPDLIGLAGITMTDAQEKLLGDFIDLEADMQFTFDGAVIATLEMGLDMSGGGVPTPFVGSNTGFRIQMKASASADLSMSLGPLTFAITGGSVTFDDGAATPGFAFINFGLDADYPLSGLVGTAAERSTALSNVINGFGLTYAGQLDVKLPITTPALTPVDAPLWLRIPDFGALITNKVTTDKMVTFPEGGTDFKTILENMLGGIEVNPIKALLTDRKALIDGLKNIFTKVNLVVAGADGVLSALNVPVVGSKLQDLVKDNFIGSFQDAMLNKIETELNNLNIADDDTMASLLNTAMGTFFTDQSLLLTCDADAESCPYEGANPKVVLREAGSANNPGVVFPAINDDGTLKAEYADDNLENVDSIQWDLVLGFNKVFTTNFTFALGLEDLPVEFKMNENAVIKFEVGWHLKLRFGMSLSKGPFLDVQGDDDLSVYAKLSFENLGGEGTLGFMGVDLQNKNEITALSGSVIVDVKETDGDGKLTFPELKKGAKGLLSMTAAFEYAAGFDMTLGVAGVGGLPEFLASFFTYNRYEKVLASTTGVTSILTPTPAAPSPVSITEVAVATPPMTPAPEDYSAQNLEGQILVLDVGLKLGKFVQNMLEPIFTKLNEFLGPFKPILDALTKPLPVVSDIAGKDVSLMELPELLINGLLGAGGPVRGSVKNVLAYLNAIKEVLELVIVVTEAIEQIAADLAAGNDIIIDFGNWNVKGGASRWTGYIPVGYAGHTGAAHTPHVLSTGDNDIPDDVKNAGGKGGKIGNLFSRLTDPNSVFNLPFLSPSGVMNIITGKDVDLFVLNTPRMEVDVTIDFWFPVALVVIVDFYGSFKFQAGVSIGYDTSGIRSAISSGDWTEAINGFFISDTDKPTGTDGNDIPELYSKGVVRIGGTLNVGLAKLSGSGELSFEGSIDLFDPNNDGKIRLGEIISVIKKDGFIALFNIKIKMCAGLSLAVEIFNPFVNWKCKWYGCWPRGRWESVWKFKKSICFLNIDTTPAPLPVLAELSSSTLKLNVGPRASKRVSGNTQDGPEYFTVLHVDGASPSTKVVVKFGPPPASGKEDNRATEEHTGVAEYTGDGGSMGDTFLLTNPVVGGAFVGGNGGTDRLIVDFSTLTGTIAAGTVSNSGDTGSISGFGLAAAITFRQFEEVTIRTNDGADSVAVTGLHSSAKLFLQLGNGNDRAVVTTGPTDGAVVLSASGGRDTLTLRAGATTSSDGKLTDSQVSGLGMAGGVTYSSVEVLRVELSTGSDAFLVESTASGCKVDVLAMGNAKDTITVGASSGLDQIRGQVTVTGDGSSLSELVVTDEASTTGGTGSLESGRVLGLGLFQDGLLYYDFAQITVKTSQTKAVAFEVASTHPRKSFVYTGGAADAITVSGVQGETKIYSGEGTDSFTVPVVASAAEEQKRLGAFLFLDGGKHNDNYHIGMSGKGTSLMQISDSGWGSGDAEVNNLEVYGTTSDDTFLFRKNFIALIHGSDAERIDMDGSINGGIKVFGYKGDDTFATDGTSGLMEQFGGAGDDVFLVGQLYNSERVEGKVGSAADVFETTETTRGFLSDGNNKHMACYGESGKDSFIVMRNVGTLSLSGGIGNDRFTVRSFALQREEDKVNPDKQQKETDVRTDEGDDTVYYAINAPVAIDGGPGFDTLVAIGTELNDDYIVTRDGIYGAGRHTAFIGIESVELATDAGDDAVYVMSTASEVKTSIFAGLGSDTVWITPRYSVPVSASDLRGHNGIVEHAVSSADGDYDELQVHGVTAYVADVDTPEVVFQTVTQHPMVLEEFTFGSGYTSFAEYTVRLTHEVTTDDVYVILGVPAGSSEIPKASGLLAGEKGTWSQTLTFNSGNWNVPRTVSVFALPDSANEGKSVPMIGHSVEQHGNSDGYNNLVVNMIPVTLMDSDQAEVYVVKPQQKNGIRIAEKAGGTGTVERTISYDVLLRPCVSQASGITITVGHDEQVTVDKTSLSFNTGNKCKQTVTVTAVDDDEVEGFHFASLSHTVVGSNKVFKSGLEAGYLNVEILDDDAPTVAVLESYGETEVLETGTYDTYDLYLTKAPTEDVTIDVNVLNSQVWGNSAAAKKEVRTEPESLTFSSSTYDKIQTVKVYAVTDGAVDSEVTHQVASQPALAYQIQGSLTVGGGEAPEGGGILQPVVFPGETDIAAYPGPVSATLSVLEDQQTDRLVLENSGGFLPTNVQLVTTLLEDGKSVARITGMGMGVDRTLAGETIYGGVTYYDFEEVVLNLGPSTDNVTVDGTHAGATYVNGGKGQDTFWVHATDGPVYLSGDRDVDTFNIGDLAGSVQDIKDLVVVLGGTETDVLKVKGYGSSDAGVLTRTELTGMGMVGVSPFPVQALSVRGTSGLFTVSFGVTLSPLVNETVYTLVFNYGDSAATLATAMQAAVFPSDTCGAKQESGCALSFAVDKLGDDTYLVRYMGEVVGGDVTITALTLDTSTLVNEKNELYEGVSIDSRKLAAGIAYANVESLNVELSEVADAFNVRGTSIPTVLTTGLGDDTVAVGSDTNIAGAAAASTTAEVAGRLDYVEALLTINGGASGRNRLLVADTEATEGKTNVELTSGLITGLAPVSIVYTGADYTRGITVWTGAHADTVHVSSTFGVDGASRTVTSLFTGEGKDTVTVALTDGVDGFFVAGTEGGDDTIDATASTLPLVLVGGAGSDTILAGQADDVIFGDEGHVLFDGMDVGLSGSTSAPLNIAVGPPTSVIGLPCVAGGGNDSITSTGPSSEIVIGGPGNDIINTDSGSDIVLGDDGFVTLVDGKATEVRSRCTTMGGEDTITTRTGHDVVVGGNALDTITTESGRDVVIGDHGVVTLTHVGGVRLVSDARSTDFLIGAGDELRTGDDEDVVIGGAGGDKVWAGSAADVVLGDNGFYTATADGEFTYGSLATGEDLSGVGAADELRGEDGADHLVGGQGMDKIWGGAHKDKIFGDQGNAAVSAAAQTFAGQAEAPASGDGDFLYGEGDDDVLVGGAGSDHIEGGSENDAVFGGFGQYSSTPTTTAMFSTFTTDASGTNTVFCGAGDDVAFGGGGGDTLHGEGGADVLFGDHGKVTTDTATATYTYESIACGDASGADTINGNGDSDFIFGGAAKDTIFGNVVNATDAHADVVFGDHGKVELVGTVSTYTSLCTTDVAVGDNDVITTDVANDFVFGGQGSDTVHGNAGQDVIFGDFGKVVLTPDSTLSVYESISTSDGAGDFLYSNSGDDYVFGGAGGDEISAGEDKDVVFGDSGRVEINVNDAARTYESTSCSDGGADTINGNVNSDYIFGGVGKDKIWGNVLDGTDADADVLFGDHGKVVLAGTASLYEAICTTNAAEGDNDTLVGASGNDFVFGGQSEDTVHGNSGADVIFGDFGMVTLTPDSATVVYESISPSHGARDFLYSHDGDDFVFGGVGGDEIESGIDSDTVFGDHGKYELVGTKATRSSVFTGVASEGGNDGIITLAGNDHVFGGQGEDTINTNEGNDVVFGDFGVVTLTPDSATTVYESISPSHGALDHIFTHSGDDFVFGGVGGDDIESGIDNDTVFGDHGTFELVGTKATRSSVFTGVASEGGNDGIITLAGNDHVFGGQGEDSIYTNDGDDVVFGDFGVVTLTPDTATTVYESISPAHGELDHIFTHDGDDFVFGGIGGDEIESGIDSDTVFGDHGKYELVGTASTRSSIFTDVASEGGDDGIIALAGNDHVFGGQGEDTIKTNEGNDIVFGDFGIVTLTPDSATTVYESISPSHGALDHIFTHSGDDFVFGGVGGDEIESGIDSDTVFGDHGKYELVGTKATRSCVSTAIASEGGNDGIITLAGNDHVFGGQGEDTINTNEGNDIVFGDFGIVTLTPDSATTVYESISPSHGALDHIFTHAGDDFVFGGVGGDDIESGIDNDTVFGDHGKYELVGTASTRSSIFTDVASEGGKDVITTLAGNDHVFGGQNEDTIKTNEGNDIVFGDFGVVTLTPDSATTVYESISPSHGALDHIFTHSGDDTVFGGVGGDEIESGSDKDTVFGDHGKVTHTGASSVLTSAHWTVLPLDGKDTINTGSENDIVFGGNDRDIIDGSSGDDWIFGDHGVVTLDTNQVCEHEERKHKTQTQNTHTHTHHPTFPSRSRFCSRLRTSTATSTRLRATPGTTTSSAVPLVT